MAGWALNGSVQGVDMAGSGTFGLTTTSVGDIMVCLSAVTGLSAVVITTTSTETDATNPVTCADGDLFAPVLSSISGTPDGLSLTFIFDVSP